MKERNKGAKRTYKRLCQEEAVNRELLEALEQITDEEERLLSGETVIEKQRYTSYHEFVVDSHKMLEHDELIALRTHTRFVDFPAHRHNYIEVMYVCKGRIIHEIQDQEVILEAGDLLFMNQHSTHAIKAAGRDDIGINFMILPEFFDTTLGMLEKDNILADFLIGVLRRTGSEGRYLHFKTAGILQIQNIIENLVYSLIYRENENKINQTLMGLLFLYLSKHTKSLNDDAEMNYEDVIILTVLRYIDKNYKTASLTELAQNMNQSLSGLSRLIRHNTGCTFKELLQRKRFQIAMMMLCDTDMPVSAVITAVGYENNSYFHRRFRAKFDMSPKEYRNLHQKGDIIKL